MTAEAQLQNIAELPLPIPLHTSTQRAGEFNHLLVRAIHGTTIVARGFDLDQHTKLFNHGPLQPDGCCAQLLDPCCRVLVLRRR